MGSWFIYLVLVKEKKMGKEKCKALKEIRRKIAEENDINLVIEECTYQGECKGTCPRCEEELRYLELELEKKKKLGKAVAIVGISAIAVGATACAASYATEKATELMREVELERTSGIAADY